MKAYTKISSTMNIVVTAGLQFQDVTNKDAHIPDRLRVSPKWTDTTCKIYQGTGYYPSEVTLWNTVKALVKDGILTIGEDTDDPTGSDNVKVDDNIVEKKRTLRKNMKSDKQFKLDDIAEA